ncbi:hypothetical protein CDD80_2316 [Ophiocordyceps camponoti-rufipedis]|uniref:IQ domain-containing protein IQM6 n=1 Tax=Ophiocordyceps camponoti-rufipedis TaxID=2004952 RepID=A0A2C5XKI5_9HYPO|nr:hypothetical protein CDD80_2316 [Ophiocordyceps camponoti-rufipedis]
MSLSDVGAVAVPKSKAYMDSLVPPDRDRFERIARVQEEKEMEARRRARQYRKSLHPSLSPSPRRSDEARNDAACVIQKTFRGYRTRREMDGFGLDASTRWVAAIREAQFRLSIKPRAAPSPGLPAPALPTLDDPIDVKPLDARRKWKKASRVVRHAGHDDDDFTTSGSDDDDDDDVSATTGSSHQRAEARRRREQANRERRQAARMMGLQYFLEMVDVKHRYGSNLRMYHEEWKKSDTTDNFFFWLDYGQGRIIELDACPRDRLEREQVRYLSREERQYYLVVVDVDGRLCWARNGDHIDTTERFKDSAHGIVPADDPTPAYSPPHSPSHPAGEGHASDSDSSSDDEDEDEDEEAAGGQDGQGDDDRHHRHHHGRRHHNHHHRHHKSKDDDQSEEDRRRKEEADREADREAKYMDPGFEEAHGLKRVTHVSASTIFNKLLRKSVRKNTWIFVADTSFRLYVGIKESGLFQHSSFLQGGRISAAGLIKIKDGRLSSLSPLSGHYRPPASNFRAFVHSLRDTGVDMSHVSISKSYAVLVGLETYVKTRRKGKHLVDKLVRRKEKIMAPEEFRKRQEAEKDKSESAEKERLFLERQKEEEKSGSVAERLLAMGGLRGGKNDDGHDDQANGLRQDVEDADVTATATGEVAEAEAVGRR